MRHFIRLVAATALLAWCAAGAAVADDVIANVGAQPIKEADLKDFIEGLSPAQREQAARDPKIAVQIVRSAIGRKLILGEAEKQGWDKKPEIAEDIARARQQVVLQTFVTSVTALPPNVPSEAEIRAAYDANREHLLQYHIAQIYVAEPPGSTAETVAATEKKAHDLVKKAKAKGADFAALARTNSDDTASASKGGDLGWLAENQILPEILGAVKAMPEKAVTEPIHAAGGWHIMTVLGVKPAELSQVHDVIASALRQGKAAQAQQAYVEKLLTDSKLTVNETAAAALFAAKK